MLAFAPMETEYFEIDHSAMAHETEKFFAEREANSPTTKFAQYCEEFPWAPECKMYDV